MLLLILKKCVVLIMPPVCFIVNLDPCKKRGIELDKKTFIPYTLSVGYLITYKEGMVSVG
jgi:hypothetical protein